MNKGLTFVGLMVTISIIFITSLILSTNYPKIQKELALQRAGHKIAQDLRRTQAAAMSAQCSPCQIIFDINQKISYQVLEKTVNLEKGVEIISLSPASPLTISFSSPNPDVIINNNPSILDAEIIISNNGSTKTVKINKVGRIQIE